MAKIHELRFELLDHQPNSPDLAPSDFFLLPHLKIALLGQRFSSNEEAITYVNNYFAEKNAEYYLDGLQRWEHRWEKCVELQRDYAEKQKQQKIKKKYLESLLGLKLLRPPLYKYVKDYSQAPFILLNSRANR
ncbi:histonelysine Nmethyltransferase SETMARlike [Trichonephila clavipes]|nr:histonelysine Nmethyltransferase SETMARlike [Trichonephila clavipes]